MGPDNRPHMRPERHPMPPEPLLYRPCVGVMLINADGLIFAGQRRDSDSPAWQMPQGGIDEGEKPRQAALRELWEETGVTADLVDFIGKTHHWVTYDLPPELLGKVWGGKYRGQRQKWFLYRYLGRDDQACHRVSFDSLEHDAKSMVPSGSFLLHGNVVIQRDVGRLGGSRFRIR